MAIETWQAEHRSVVCCVCLKRGPDVLHKEDWRVRQVAEAAGWWTKQYWILTKVPELAGSCMNPMQGIDAIIGSHRIEFKEKSESDYRCICPSCRADICCAAAEAPPEPPA